MNINDVQTYIEKKLGKDNFPSDFVEKTVYGIAGSFFVSGLFAKNNRLGAGLTAGAMTIVAAIADAVFKLIAKNSWDLFIGSAPSIGPYNLYETRLDPDVSKVAYLTTLYFGKKLNLQINYKGSFALAGLMYIWNVVDRNEIPIRFFVIRG